VARSVDSRASNDATPSGDGIVVAFEARDTGPASGLLDRFETIRRDVCPWLLDSAQADGRLGRFSFAGSDPWAVLRARGRELQLDVRRASHPAWRVGAYHWRGDPFEALRRLAPAGEPAGQPTAVPFVGGAVGYFGYELVEQLEPVELRATDGAPFPDLVFLLVDSLLAYDHARGRVHHCGLGFSTTRAGALRAASGRVEALAAREAAGSGVPTLPTPTAPSRPAAVEARHDAGSYAALVDTVKASIEEGDVYQACLTHRLEVDWAGEPWQLYRRLRRSNPAPFAAYLGLPEGAVLSSSPERFLRVESGARVEARPIKGTSDCGTTEASAEASRTALAASAKDRAENVMIVDLYRNDLGRVCETGSVAVPELCAIERHGRLHQMVSTVTGRLAEGRDRMDLVRAAFPPGSMTGAPKIAAMRLLAGLETVRRGVYSGALGYLDARGGMDLSVVIRTLLVSEGRAHVHVGGGVVADSCGPAEYRESMDKARALLEALGAEIAGEDEQLAAVAEP